MSRSSSRSRSHRRLLHGHVGSKEQVLLLRVFDTAEYYGGGRGAHYWMEPSLHLSLPTCGLACRGARASRCLLAVAEGRCTRRGLLSIFRRRLGKARGAVLYAAVDGGSSASLAAYLGPCPEAMAKRRCTGRRLVSVFRCRLQKAVAKWRCIGLGLVSASRHHLGGSPGGGG